MVTIMKTFDDILVRRPTLANAYLALITSQPGRPLALFAPRRVGKTVFLNEDVTPEAKAIGFLTVYCDLWLNKQAPIEAINHALEEALDDLLVPVSSTGKAAKTIVKKVSVMGSGVDLGDGPQRRPLPADPAFRMDALFGRLSTEHGGKVLLLLDEAQSLGAHPQGIDLISTLRAALTKHKNKVFSILTGSSQVDLAKMFSNAGAPMYQYAQKVDFPFLGEEFLQAVSQHFTTVHPGKVIQAEALSDLFARLGYKPAVLRDIVKIMSTEGIVDVKKGLNLYLNDPSRIASWRSLLDSLDDLEILLLHAIAKQAQPYGKSAAADFEKRLGVRLTPAKLRSAVDRLIKKKLIAKLDSGHVINDETFAEYLLETQPKLMMDEGTEDETRPNSKIK